MNGAGEVFIHGRSYRVAAAVHTIGGLSAHGDRSDLLRWMSGFRNRPDVYVVHGDGEAKRSFRNAIEDELQLHASIPNHGDLVKF